MTKWHVEVDARSCMGSGMCAALAPEWFALDTDLATVMNSEVDPDDILLDAADSCPALAITVTAPGGDVVGPRP